MPKASGPEDKISHRHFNLCCQKLSILTLLILKKSWNVKSEQIPFTRDAFLKLPTYVEKEFWKRGTALYRLVLIAFPGIDSLLHEIAVIEELNKTRPKYSQLWWAPWLVCRHLQTHRQPEIPAQSRADLALFSRAPRSVFVCKFNASLTYRTNTSDN